MSELNSFVFLLDLAINISHVGSSIAEMRGITMSFNKIFGLFGIIGAIVMILSVFLAWGHIEGTVFILPIKGDFSGWTLGTGGEMNFYGEKVPLDDVAYKYAPIVALVCGIVGVIAAAFSMFKDNKTVNKGLGILSLILAVISIVVIVLYTVNVSDGYSEEGIVLTSSASYGAYIGIVGALLMIIYGILGITSKTDDAGIADESTETTEY